MARIIAIANQKGGVAKTTTTQNLAVALAMKGKKVLMIDFDSQASLTVAVGLEPLDYEDNCIVQVMEDPKTRRNKSITECIAKTPDDRAWIVPSIIDLANLEWQIFSRLDRNLILKNALMPVLDEYDYILIDCPPALGIMTINAFSCADGVLVPSTTEYLSYRGLGNLEESIAEVAELINPKVRIYGVIATKHERKTKNRQILDLMLQNYPVIAVTKNLADAVAGIYDGKSVVEEVTGSQVATEYARVAQMIIEEAYPTLDVWDWAAPVGDAAHKIG